MVFWSALTAQMAAMCLSVLVVDSESSFIRDKFYHTMRRSCQKSHEDFCFEKFDYQLQKKVDEIVEKKKLYAVLPEQDHSIYVDRVNLDTYSLCRENIHRDQAYFLRDENNKTRVVVQSAHFKQYIYMAFCLKEGRLTSASWIPSSDFTERNLTCVQKYMDFKFLVINEAWDDVEFVKTAKGVPVCCTCLYNKY